MRLYFFSFFLLIVLMGGAVLIGYQFYSPLAFDGEKRFVVASGETVSEIGQGLVEEKIIRSKWWFEVFILLQQKETALKAGEYTFRSSSLSQIISELVRGEPRKQISLTFIEGWTRRQMAEYVSSRTDITEDAFLDATDSDALEEARAQFDFLVSVPEGHTLEGFLFPDTYHFFEDVKEDDIVRRMLERFAEKLIPDMRLSISNSQYSLFDIVIMASIVEREVRSLSDMKLVAGIFWKRLESGVPLQADSTVNYITGGLNPSLTAKETRLDSQYNTYLYPGLPYGPISNPGLNSLIAAVYPEESEYWFFLSTPLGKTVFSKSLDEHNRAKQKYLQ